MAIFGNLMAVALANAVRTSNGHVVFFELQGTSAPTFLAVHEVGALPDMITFTEDGAYALTANEGEPNSYGLQHRSTRRDRFQSSRWPFSEPSARSSTVGFERFDNPGQRKKLESEGVRIFGPGRQRRAGPGARVHRHAKATRRT